MVVAVAYRDGARERGDGIAAAMAQGAEDAGALRAADEQTVSNQQDGDWVELRGISVRER